MSAGRNLCSLTILALALTTAACGGNASLSPAGPSGTATTGGAVITGRVSGIATAAANDTAFRTMAMTSVTVTVVGTNISTTIDGAGRFTLNNVPAGTVQLRFAGGGADATVTLSGIGASDRIDITVTVNGDRARIDSEHRGRGGDANDDDDDDENDDADELKGTVSGVSGTCPSLTFTVNGKTVKTNASTVFENVACAQIANGTRVEVKGAPQSDGTLTAKKVERD